MTFLFVERKPLLFSNLSNSKEIIFSAEKPAIIKHIVICNRVNIEIRINLEMVVPLSNPLQRAFLQTQIRVGKFGSRDLCVLEPNVDNINVGSTHKIDIPMVDACNLICYSNGVSEKFDCSIFYSEMNELEEYV